LKIRDLNLNASNVAKNLLLYLQIHHIYNLWTVLETFIQSRTVLFQIRISYTTFLLILEGSY
jgi:hypothetical protein